MAIEAIRAQWNTLLNQIAETPAYWHVTPVNFNMYRVITAWFTRRHYDRVLDVGAGNLAFKPLVLPHASTYLSIDLTFRSNHLDMMGSGEDLPFRNDSFDCVICSAVLEHTPHPERLLRECGRVLSPGGDILLTVPHIHQIHGEPHDYWRFTRCGIDILAKKAGLNFERVEIIESGYMLSMLFGSLIPILCAHLLNLRALRKVVLFAFKYFIDWISRIDRYLGPSCFPVGYISFFELKRG